MSGLKPFFCFYGGKYRAAPRYPVPLHRTIVEPFAGAAGYATRYYGKTIVLCDSDPIIAGLWAYLIRVRRSEIEALPIGIEHVDQIRGPQEAKWLVGWWMAKGSASPQLQATSRMKSGFRPRSHWGSAIRSRIAAQVTLIRHWTIRHGSYESLSDREATWFIDPPYSGPAGRHYRHHQIDYPALAEWCRSRRGQTIVCENAGADWLPFRPFATIRAGRGSKRIGKDWSDESIWTQGCHYRSPASPIMRNPHDGGSGAETCRAASGPVPPEPLAPFPSGPNFCLDSRNKSC